MRFVPPFLRRKPPLLGELYSDNKVTVIQRPPMSRTVFCRSEYHLSFPYTQMYIFHGIQWKSFKHLTMFHAFRFSLRRQ